MRDRATYLAVCLGGLGCLFAAGPAEVSYIITTVAGTDFAGDGGAAASAQLGQAQGLAVDSNGNIYVADASGHRVRKITPAGMITTVVGTGRPGFAGDGGPATIARLNRPYGLALDGFGDLYIADLGNGRVRKVSSDGVIRTVVGGGSTLPSPEGGDAIQAQIGRPRNLVLDSTGNLYVSDFADHCVYRVTREGMISRVAGTGAKGASGDGGPAISAQLDSPAGLAVDPSGVLFIADTGNSRIRKIQGNVISTLPNAAGLPGSPTGLALDNAGNLYIAISGIAQVLKLAADGRRPFAGTGTPGYSGDGGPAASARLTDPQDLAFDWAGNLYIGDARRVRKVAGSGLVTTVAGDGTFRPLGDGGPAIAAHLNGPAGLALDAGGNLYFTDGRRVRKVSKAGLISTVAGTEAGGSSADGGLATLAFLSSPDGLASDAWGNLWIADSSDNRIRKVSVAGLITTAAGVPRNVQPSAVEEGVPASSVSLGSPKGVALDSAGNLYIADTGNHLVRKVTPAGLVFTVAGKRVRGSGGDGGAATSAQLNSPAGVCVDSQGNLYIADTYNHSIRKVTPQGVISTVAGGGSGGDGGPASSARLAAPTRVAADSAGNLYIADSGNNRIRKVAPDGVITTIAGSGVAGYEGDGGPALLAQLDNPRDLAVDGAGNVYIADFGNDRLRKLTPASGTIPPAPLETLNLVSAASLMASPIAPGQIATIHGSGLGPPTAVGPQLKASGLLDTQVAETQVLFDGTPAPLLYVQDSQINLQVPYSVAGLGAVEVEVRRGGVVKIRGTVPVVEAAPAIFTTGWGTGQAAALNEDGSVNSIFNPAPRGALVTLYATGEGQTDPPGVNGKPSVSPFPKPLLPMSLRIGGDRAEVQFVGSAPGLVGLLQINARVPEYIGAGNQTVELVVGIARSQPGVTLAIQ